MFKLNLPTLNTQGPYNLLVLISGLVVAGDGTIETEGMCNKMATGHCPIEAELIGRVTGSAEAEARVGTMAIGNRRQLTQFKEIKNEARNRNIRKKPRKEY